MTRTIKLSVIGLFLLLVGMPLLQQHLNLVRIPPLQENRLKKKRPANWMHLFDSDADFSKGFEEYFNDNYGFRDFLIRIKNQIDFGMFRKSEKVLIGRDGWLFYRSVVDSEEVVIEKMSGSEWNRLFARLTRLNQTLASRGMTLVIMPCPMKNSIYPEMLPADAPRRPNPTSFERYRAFLKSHPEIVTVDPLPLLMNLKSSMQVYYRTDFHWTDAAGAYAAKSLVQKLGSLSGRLGLWEQPISVVLKKEPVGGEGQSLALLWHSGEIAPFPAAARLDLDRGIYANASNAYEWTYTTKLADKSGLIPDTVMFGDSYSDAFVRAGFTAYFSKLQRFYNWDFAQKFHSIPDGTRFVILQHVEPIIMLNHLPFWPEELRGD